VTATTYVLFPGRHHGVTRFQVDYLRDLLAGREPCTDGSSLDPADDAQVVWAVTSASHVRTRRNPVSGPRRVGLIERVSAVESLPSLVVTVPDVPPHPRFAQLVVTSAATDLGVALSPDNTVVACSTPTVAAEYAALGFRIAAVEASRDPAVARPWDLVEACAEGDEAWTAIAHPETTAYWRRYGCDRTIRELFTDPTVSDEGDLTETRDYRTYASAFETASERKWDIVGAHLQPGRVVDIGCATGGLLEKVAEAPAFFESDLFGVDVARPLLAEAEHKKASGVFRNPNVWFVHANVLTTDVMPPRSVDTTVTVALTHEICSYGAGRADLEVFARRIYEHSAAGGVWVNSDVLGPADGDRLVRLRLRADGTEPTSARTDLDDLPREEVRAVVEALSPAGRMVQFAHDFPRLSGAAWSGGPVDADTWELPLRLAMEFLTRKDYTDNWLSECHERFCDLSYADWVDLLTGVGFTLDGASGPVRNEWLVEHRFDPDAGLTDLAGRSLRWPDTHVLTVARRATSG
jgi:SAM-dependent methyltransferase